MIRLARQDDLDALMEIWLEANLQAHDFLPAAYWQSNAASVRRQLPQAQVYVYESEDGAAEGFLGLIDSYIAGLFVRSRSQSRGVGRQLLRFAQDIWPALSLHVYEKNRRAVRFYQRGGFRIQQEQLDSDTGQREYAMVWQAKALPSQP